MVYAHGRLTLVPIYVFLSSENWLKELPLDRMLLCKAKEEIKWSIHSYNWNLESTYPLLTKVHELLSAVVVVYVESYSKKGTEWEVLQRKKAG